VTLLAEAGTHALTSASGPSCYSRLTNEWICGQYLTDRKQEVIDATVQHIWITVVAVLVGLVIAFPLALLARRLPRLEALILGVTTGIYTIPSLALFPLMVPFTGLTATTVVIGLALYALTILVRSLLEGLRSVPDEVRESATGLGYNRTQLLLRIELPLALPVVMAGLRVATVSTVALTTVGSLVAYGGLGNLIKDGVLTNFRAELFTASLLCVVLAILLDVLLVLAQRLLTPWSKGVRA
jgi:osmoprotectant transport system permease protein